MKKINWIVIIVYILLSCNNKTDNNHHLPLVDTAITQASVNIRLKPSVVSKKIMQLQQFDEVTILEKGRKDTLNHQEDFWYKVEINNGEIGWIFGAYTSLKITGQKTQIFEFTNYDFNDLEHIFFNDKNNKEIDFGQAYNNLCGYNFQFDDIEYGEYKGNPKYIGKEFKITYNYLLSDKLCDVTESYKDSCIIPVPTIIKIELN